MQRTPLASSSPVRAQAVCEGLLATAWEGEIGCTRRCWQGAARACPQVTLWNIRGIDPPKLPFHTQMCSIIPVIAILRLPSLILALPVFTGSWALVTEVPEHATSRLLYKALVEN